MYYNAGYLSADETDLLDTESSLRINSCGNYRLINCPLMSTVRPLGREDYQLLYLASGKADFLINQKEYSVTKGQMVLYRPGQPQQYSYTLEESPDVYWVHFTGRDAEMLVCENGWKNTSLLSCGISPKYQELFLQMIRELQIPRTGSDDLLALMLRQVLLLVNRYLSEGTHSRISPQIEEAVHYFHENFYRNIEMEEYAASRHMSTCWFIRCFRQQMGVPPLKYLTSIRMAKAKQLLEGSSCSVSEISSIVGYEDPLYFSRLFKKQTGQSPTAYQKAIWTQ